MYGIYEELEPSWATQLDLNGRQPHSREMLEYEVNCGRSTYKYDMIEPDIHMSYMEGIHFGSTP
jgi:hypothetical protein